MPSLAEATRQHSSEEAAPAACLPAPSAAATLELITAESSEESLSSVVASLQTALAPHLRGVEESVNAMFDLKSRFSANPTKLAAATTPTKPKDPASPQPNLSLPECVSTSASSSLIGTPSKSFALATEELQRSMERYMRFYRGDDSTVGTPSAAAEPPSIVPFKACPSPATASASDLTVSEELLPAEVWLRERREAISRITACASAHAMAEQQLSATLGGEVLSPLLASPTASSTPSVAASLTELRSMLRAEDAFRAAEEEERQRHRATVASSSLDSYVADVVVTSPESRLSNKEAFFSDTFRQEVARMHSREAPPSVGQASQTYSSRTAQSDQGGREAPPLPTPTQEASVQAERPFVAHIASSPGGHSCSAGFGADTPSVCSGVSASADGRQEAGTQADLPFVSHPVSPPPRPPFSKGGELPPASSAAAVALAASTPLPAPPPNPGPVATVAPRADAVFRFREFPPAAAGAGPGRLPKCGVWEGTPPPEPSSPPPKAEPPWLPSPSLRASDATKTATPSASPSVAPKETRAPLCGWWEADLSGGRAVFRELPPPPQTVPPGATLAPSAVAAPVSDPTPPVDDALAPSATPRLSAPAVAAPPPSTAAVPKPLACDEDALESVELANGWRLSPAAASTLSSSLFVSREEASARLDEQLGAAMEAVCALADRARVPAPFALRRGNDDAAGDSGFVRVDASDGASRSGSSSGRWRQEPEAERGHWRPMHDEDDGALRWEARRGYARSASVRPFSSPARSSSTRRSHSPVRAVREVERARRADRRPREGEEAHGQCRPEDPMGRRRQTNTADSRGEREVHAPSLDAALGILQPQQRERFHRAVSPSQPAQPRPRQYSIVFPPLPPPIPPPPPRAYGFEPSPPNPVPSALPPQAPSPYSYDTYDGLQPRVGLAGYATYNLQPTNAVQRQQHAQQLSVSQHHSSSPQQFYAHQHAVS